MPNTVLHTERHREDALEPQLQVTALGILHLEGSRTYDKFQKNTMDGQNTLTINMT